MKDRRRDAGQVVVRRVGRAASKGWAALLLCTVLILSSSLLNLVLHRATVQREQDGVRQWARLQVQALGHGGQMWALARLEDTRPVDSACRASASSGSAPRPTQGQSEGPSMTFSQRVAQPGGRVRCAVALDADEPAPDHWRCDCSGNPVITGESDAMPGPSGWLMIDFTGDRERLTMTIEATLSNAADAGARWRETVALRQQPVGLWRAQVGTWQDDR